MKPLLIKGTEFTPEILFDPNKQYMLIKGFSRPEDVRGFYQKFFDWFENNQSEIEDSITDETTLKIEFHLIYFNSASSKCLLDMILLINQVYENRLDVTWHYEEGDEDLLEAGEEFSDAVEVEFKYIEVES